MLCLHVGVELESMHSCEKQINRCNASTKYENVLMTHGSLHWNNIHKPQHIRKQTYITWGIYCKTWTESEMTTSDCISIFSGHTFCRQKIKIKPVDLRQGSGQQLYSDSWPEYIHHRHLSSGYYQTASLAQICRQLFAATF